MSNSRCKLILLEEEWLSSCSIASSTNYDCLRIFSYFLGTTFISTLEELRKSSCCFWTCFTSSSSKLGWRRELRLLPKRPSSWLVEGLLFISAREGLRFLDMPMEGESGFREVAFQAILEETRGCEVSTFSFFASIFGYEFLLENSESSGILSSSENSCAMSLFFRLDLDL